MSMTFQESQNYLFYNVYFATGLIFISVLPAVNGFQQVPFTSQMEN